MIIPTMQLLSIHALQDLRQGLINDIAQRKARHAPYKALENYLFKATACIMQKKGQMRARILKARANADYKRIVAGIDNIPCDFQFDWQKRRDFQ